MFPSDTDYDTKVTLESEATLIDDDLPFHILLLGDWSGKESRSAKTDLQKLNPIEIDRDNFEDVLEKLDVKLSLDFQGDDKNTLSLNFRELEDFHPDKIFRQLPLFADLRDVRRRLLDANTFNAAANEVQSWYSEIKSEEEFTDKSSIVSGEASTISSDNLLDDILTQNSGNISESQSQSIVSSVLSTFIKKLVKPHLIQIDTAEQSNLLMIVDEVISDLMRKILHHPHFQALESAWRGINFLVRRVETDSDLKIYILDVCKNELASNLKNVDNLEDSSFFQIIKDKKGFLDDKPWAVVCGNYTFSLNVDDVATLLRIARIADTSITPFISHIKPEMFGFEAFHEDSGSENWKFSEDSSIGKLWTFLRDSPEAKYLGLSISRILVRLPYGDKTEPTETFYFEEFIQNIQHEEYLWFNPIFVNVLLLANTFRKYGWNISQNLLQDVDGLPMYLYQDETENITKPCAEVLMTQTNCEKIMEQGLIPLISYKNTDKVRIGRFQSVARPFSLLKGRWG